MSLSPFVCRACNADFEAPYFWDHLGDVTCPHCGAVNETEFDEGDDGVIGPWTTGIVKLKPKSEPSAGKQGEER